MNVLAILTAPAAALALTPVQAAVAQKASAETQVQADAQTVAHADTHIDAGAEAQIETETQSEVVARIEDIRADDELATEMPMASAMPVKLVSWDGDFELMKTSRRLRIWRTHIAYSLTVDAAGTATNCELTETFRMRRISDRLCEVLMAHHTFEPAQNADGVAVEGNYTARISYQEMMERL